MLSRVADNLYWMSRYLERAEHTARLLDVNLYGMLDQVPQSAEDRWERVLISLRQPLTQTEHDPFHITRALTTDCSNPASIVSCISAARDSARQVWEQISSEMWEHINRFYMAVQQIEMDEIWQGEPHAYFASVKEGVHLFQGIADSTMSHGEGWQFIQLGRNLERVGETAALLNTYFTGPDIPLDSSSPAYQEWISLLKCCTAFEAYVKFYSASIEPKRIAAFLLLGQEFPRSILFAARSVRAALQAIARSTGGRSSRPERLAGRLQASLEFGHIDEIMEGDLHEFLDSICLQCDQIHTSIYQTFIRYPVAAALSAQTSVR